MAAVVPSAVQLLPAQCASPLYERRQCGQHHAGEGSALLGFGERDSAGLRFGERGPRAWSSVRPCRTRSAARAAASIACSPSSRPSRLLSVRFESGGSARASESASLRASKVSGEGDVSGPVAAMSAAGREDARSPDRSTP